MPKEIKAYACSWNCGRNVLTVRKRMVRHEGMCNWNPANRACITCKHFSPGEPASHFDHDDPGEPCGCEAGVDLRNGLTNNCDKWSNAKLTPLPVAAGVERNQKERNE